MTRAGNTTTRGYGAKHQAERAKWKPVVERGEGWCAEVVCLEPDRWINPESEWDLAHGDTRDTYRGPSHRRCNRSEGATRGNLARGATPTPSPRWNL